MVMRVRHLRGALLAALMTSAGCAALIDLDDPHERPDGSATEAGAHNEGGSVTDHRDANADAKDNSNSDAGPDECTGGFRCNDGNAQRCENGHWGAITACTGDTFICDPSIGCRSCQKDQDCAANASGPACQNNKCVECTTSNTTACPPGVQCKGDNKCGPCPTPGSHVCKGLTTSRTCTATGYDDKSCSDSAPICNSKSGLCAGCTNDPDCLAVSSSLPHCQASSGTCVQCTSSSHCSGSTPNCNIATGTCELCEHQADGTSCGTDGQHFCKSGTCGSCVPGGSCTPANECRQGSFICSGGQKTCSDVGNVVNDTPCKTGYCESGSCVACSPAPGTACTPSACQTGKEICTTSGASCQATGSAPDGTICASGECFGGACKTCGTINWPASNGWTAVSTSGPTRYGHAMTFDSVHGRVIAFGGYPTTGSNGDNGTYTWNGSTWSTPTITTKPPARAYTSMTFDDFHGKAVLYGGFYGSSEYGDTWTWDGVSTAWSPVTCSGNCPQARDQAGLAYDSDRHVVLMFGGQTATGAGLGDTWQLDVGTGAWSPVSPSNSPPAAVAQMAYDAQRKVFVAFIDRGLPGIWEYNAATNTWSDHSSASPSPGKRSHSRIAYDASLKRTVLFGGCVYPDCVGSTNDNYVNDRWEWDGTCWRNTTNSAKSPGVLQLFGLTYDSVRQKTVIFGGDNWPSGPVSSTTWQ